MATLNHLFVQREMSEEREGGMGTERGRRRVLSKFTAILGVPAFALLLTFIVLLPAGHAAFPGANDKIAFTSNRDGDYEIYVMNADGSGVTQLTNNAVNDFGVSDWSPDGTKLLFRSERDGNPEIYVMDADGTNQTRLTTNSGDDFQPAWSPDGTEIVFASRRPSSGSPNRIYIMNADGTTPTQLTTVGFDDQNPAWSPDGTK